MFFVGWGPTPSESGLPPRPSVKEYFLGLLKIILTSSSYTMALCFIWYQSINSFLMSVFMRFLDVLMLVSGVGVVCGGIDGHLPSSQDPRPSVHFCSVLFGVFWGCLCDDHFFSCFDGYLRVLYLLIGWLVGKIVDRMSKRSALFLNFLLAFLTILLAYIFLIIPDSESVKIFKLVLFCVIMAGYSYQESGQDVNTSQVLTGDGGVWSGEQPHVLYAVLPSFQ